MKSDNLVLKAVLLLMLSGACAVANAQIAYISSSNGYMIHDGGGVAVTTPWQGQAPISGFSGYGQISINGRCLTGRQGNQPLRFEPCRHGDTSQTWKLSGGQLNNEGGWCADVEGNRGGPGVRVLAWQCSRAVNQRFRAHQLVSAQEFARQAIRDPNISRAFVESANRARPGQLISVASGRLVGDGGGTLIGQDGAGVVATDGAGIVAAGGGNIVAAGGGNIVAAGGGNVRGTR